MFFSLPKLLNPKGLKGLRALQELKTFGIFIRMNITIRD
jgi:hypothetical protein